MRWRLASLASAAALLAAAGCGSSGGSSTHSASTTAGGAGGAAGLLTAETQSAATGDIPDNQVFITYSNPQPRYSLVAPEGWARKGSGRDVSFTDKNNRVHVVIAPGAGQVSAASVASELTRLRAAEPALAFTPPARIRLSAGEAVKSTYTTRSAPNPVTGKQVVLIVDRYELTGPGGRATIDLGTAKGVDNVDAYKKMINSFRWG
jgi:hypothetical protein